MSLKRRIYLAVIIFLGFIGELLFLGFIAATAVHAGGNAAPSKSIIQTLGLPLRSLNLISLSPVVADGKTVGALATYDDPATQRSEDYLELYDSDGELVAIGWVDQFGIERIAIDRALLEGREDLHGVFVTVVDGEPI